jgi:hypothetical protein
MRRMGPRVLRHLRANAIAYLALFVAMGGTTYAAIRLPANSVGTKQLEKGSVTGAKVAKNTLTGSNIKVSSLGTVPDAAALDGKPASSFEPSAGALTSVTAGTDLTGGGSSGAVTIGADETQLQHRVTGTCPGGSAVSSISQTGQVSCATTGVTQMMGGSAGNVSTGIQYFAPEGLTTPSGTEGNVWLQSSNLAGIAGNLSGETPTAVPAAVSFTLDVNGSPTSVSCTIPAEGSICSDSDHTAAIPAGAYVDISVTDSGVFSGRATFGWTETS